MITGAIGRHRHRSGLRRTGWGVIESDGPRLIYVASGHVGEDPTATIRWPRASPISSEGLSPCSRSTSRSSRRRRNVRQRERQGHLEARPGPQHRHAGPGDESDPRRRTHAELDQEDRRRHWPRREEKQVQMMVEMLLPKARFDSANEDRRARHRHLPRQPSTSPAQRTRRARRRMQERLLDTAKTGFPKASGLW